jgi:acyl carrier protein
MKSSPFSIGSWLGLSDKAGSKRVDAIFAGRELLDDDAFYERYFGGGAIDKEVVVGVRRAFIENVPFDMHRLSPSDSFNAELNFVWHNDSLADVELICQVEKEFQIEISEAEAKNAFRLGDLISIVDAKLKQK